MYISTYVCMCVCTHRYSFFVAGLMQSWHWGFHSCNGLSADGNHDKWGGPYEVRKEKQRLHLLASLESCAKPACLGACATIHVCLRYVCFKGGGGGGGGWRGGGGGGGGLSHHAAPIPLHGDQSNPRCTPQQYLCLAALQFVLWRDVLSHHAEPTSSCMP